MTTFPPESSKGTGPAGCEYPALTIEVDDQRTMQWLTITCDLHGLIARTEDPVILREPALIQDYIESVVRMHREVPSEYELGVELKRLIQWFEQKIVPLGIKDVKAAALAKVHEEIDEFLADLTVEEAVDAIGTIVIWAMVNGHDLAGAAHEKVDKLFARRWEIFGDRWHHVKDSEETGECICTTAEDLGFSGHGDGVNPYLIANVHPDCPQHGAHGA